MKKFFIIILALVLLAAGAIAFFIMTFDADRYRPLVLRQIEKALGSPAALDRIALVWQNGLALEIRGLKLYKDSRSMDKPVASLDRAAAGLRLGPLMNKRIEVTAVVLERPRLSVVKGRDGVARVSGVNLTSSAPTSGDGSGASPIEIRTFLIDSLKVRGGEIGYADLSVEPPTRIKVRVLDVNLKDISFERPIAFSARCALFSSTQNVETSGRLSVPGPAGPYTLENFMLKAALESVNVAELTQVVPAVDKAGIVGGLKGAMELQADRLVIDKTGLAQLTSRAFLKNGQIALSSLRSPLSAVNLEAASTTTDLEFRDLSADFARGHIQFKGSSRDFLSPSPSSQISGAIRGISLEELSPPGGYGSPQLTGRFSADLSGSARGLSWPALSRSLNGRVHVQLSDGVVRNFNLLRLVLDNLGRVPGVGDFVQNRLPPQYIPRLQNRDTALGPIDFNVNIADGFLIFDRLQIMTDTFMVLAGGRAGLDGSLDIRATLVMEPQLSQALVQNVPQLQYIADAQGSLVMPVNISGTTSHIKVLPDMDYVVQRVVAQKGQELMQDMLKKAMNKGQAQPAAQEPVDPYQKMLGQLFH